MGASAGLTFATGHSSFDPKKNQAQALSIARGGAQALGIPNQLGRRGGPAPQRVGAVRPVDPAQPIPAGAQILGPAGRAGGAAPQSTRQAPSSLLGSQPASNARSTGRSLIKDPVRHGSLLA